MRNAETRAVITGGTQGLGFAIAKRLASEGAKSIVIAGRNFEKGEAAAKAISGMGTPCEFVKTEMGNPEDAKRLIAAAIDTFGSVNALVNSAAESDGWMVKVIIGDANELAALMDEAAYKEFVGSL